MTYRLKVSKPLFISMKKFPQLNSISFTREMSWRMTICYRIMRLWKTVLFIWCCVHLYKLVAINNPATNETFPLKVKASDTIQYVKSKIHKQVSIPSDHQVLVYAGKTLEDTCTISQYNIQNQSTLSMMLFNPKSTYPIYIRTLNGNRKIKVDVDGSETIAFIKYKIQGQERIPREHQTLIFCGTELEDEKTLDEYRVQKDGVLHLAWQFRDDIDVLIRTLSTSITLRVKTTDTIETVKAMIEEKKGILTKHQQLYFKHNEELSNASTLYQCSIQNQSVLFMVQSIEIIVETATKRLPLVVKESEKISELKTIIQDIEGIHSSHQELVFGGLLLENDYTLSGYSIQKESVLQLRIKGSDAMQVADSNFAIKKKIELVEVLSALTEIENWKDVVHHLGVPKAVVNTIETDHIEEEKQKFEAFSWWMINTSTASWSQLAEALRKANYPLIAACIETYDEKPISDTDKTDGELIFPAADNIRGISVVQEISVRLTNKQQLFEWKGYGLKLTTPPQSLPNNVDHCIITIKASLSGQYQFPSRTELVSPVFWLQCNPQCKFKVPLTLEIGHCAPLENSFRLFMVRALCTQNDLPYMFKVVQGGSFSTQSSYGVVSLDKFSGLAVVQERSDERRYWSSVFYMGPAKKRNIHFAVTWDDDAHITTLKKEYEAKNALNGPELLLAFEKDRLDLDVPVRGCMQDDWKLSPTVPPKILKKNVDNHYLESKSKAVPHCELVARWMKREQEIQALEFMVNILGATDEQFFTILIDPSDSEQEFSSITSPSVRVPETPTCIKPGDENTLMGCLHKYSSKWRDIGASLNFQPGEVDNIEHSCPGATPQRLLTELLSKWVQWPTVDHPDVPTMEKLRDALRGGLVGLGAVANDLYELRNILPSSQ